MIQLKEIKEAFVAPKRNYYLGWAQFGTPYFFPRNFNSTILTTKRLILKSEQELMAFKKRYPYLKADNANFKNLPTVRRAKSWIYKLFGNWYYLEIGKPFAIVRNELGWKDKWNTPRFEWSPAFYIFFFKWQFVIWWTAPDGDNDLYYEMVLWWLKYSNKDLKKAEETWRWQDAHTKKSTWNSKYLKR